MVFRPTDICDDVNNARLALGSVCETLGYKMDTRLQTMWRVDGGADLDGKEARKFIIDSAKVWLRSHCVDGYKQRPDVFYP